LLQAAPRIFLTACALQRNQSIQAQRAKNSKDLSRSPSAMANEHSPDR